MRPFTLLFVLFCVSLVKSSGMQCLDGSGNAVSWWFIYKMPNGFDYAYKDSTDTSTELPIITDSQLNDESNPLANTLNQVYQNKLATTYLAYNDQPPNEMSEIFSAYETVGGAHAKGLVAASPDEGFWLVHSVPKFPSFSFSEFSWGEAASRTGQSFLCISMSPKTVELIAQQLMFFHPSIYDSNVADEDVYYNITQLIDGKRFDGSHILNFTSSLGSRKSKFVFTSFGKSNSWGKDLYEDLVSPYFNQGFYWETWRRSPPLPTYCTPEYPYDAININEISFPGTSFEFSYTKDHSKWGISMNDSNPRVCVGGINRMLSQRKRGGGTVCFSHVPLWQALRDVIKGVDGCDDLGVVIEE